MLYAHSHGEEELVPKADWKHSAVKTECGITTDEKDIVSKADVFIVVGTSLMVYPANNLILYADREIPKFVIDPNDMPKCEKLGYRHIKSSATEGMKVLLEDESSKKQENDDYHYYLEKARWGDGDIGRNKSGSRINSKK